MEIKINSLFIESFKGIKKFEVNFDPTNTIIKAENGKGKTTIYDAFLWLLFDKDSTGRKDFGIRPLDDNNKAIEGIVAVVQAELEIDGKSHIFRKEHHENIIKKQVRGYSTKCEIDEVVKTVTQYNDYISEIIPEDAFKMLTNLKHFTSLHWTAQRKVLQEIAGNIGDPTGFESLIESLNGRTIEDYKKVLAGQKSRLQDEQDEINPRLDEINKTLESYTEADTSELEKQRDIIKGKISKVDELRQNCLNDETARQQKINTLNNLNGQKISREAELKNDTSGIKTLLDEKQTIESNIAAARQKAVTARSNISIVSTQIQSKQCELQGLIDSKNAILAEYKKAESEDPIAGIKSEADTCFNCGQKLPANKLAENESKRIKAMEEAKAAQVTRLENINKRGKSAFESIQKVRAEIETLSEQLKNLNIEQAKAQTEFDNAEKSKTKRFAEIDKAIKENKTVPPEQDEKWRNILAEITKLENEIGEPVSEQLNALEERKNLLNNELAEINRTLAQADNIKATHKRIAELSDRKRELAQLIANVEKQLNDIANYNMERCKLLDKAVNGKFKHVNFKLFDYQFNGEIKECCECTLIGVPYSDLSYGQKIFVGIDIINVLSAHYGISVPLFIDNAEGLTLPVEFDGQTIQLMAQAGVSKLTIVISSEKTRKVA